MLHNGLNHLLYRWSDGPPGHRCDNRDVIGAKIQNKTTGLPAAVVGVVFEARTDFFGTTKFFVFLGGFGAVISFAIAAHSVDLDFIAGVSGGGFALLFLSSTAYLVWTQFRSGEAPNILRERFDRAAIREVDGVQLVVQAPATTVLSDGPGVFDVVLQNCWDAPRTCTIMIKEDRRIFCGKSGKLLYPRETPISMGPAEVVVVTIPFVAEPDARGSFSLNISARVSGSGVRRLRHWRARVLSRPIPWRLIILMAPMGALMWGGGMKIKVRTRQADHPQVELPPSATRLIWMPNEGASR